MKIFVTSNQQFGRKGAIKKYKRPFNSIKDMNSNLIDAWNSVVTDEDTVYVLGNFAWDPESFELASNSLNGDIIILKGEYDKASHEVIDTGGGGNIDYIYDSILGIPEASAVLSYWPLSEWPLKSKGSYSVIGYPDTKYKTDYKTKVINCSCDLSDYKPIELRKYVALLNDVNS